MVENWTFSPSVKYDTTILQTLEKHGASPELIAAFKLAVERVESTFPDLSEMAKAQMAQLKAQNTVLEQRVAIVSGQNDDVREKAQRLMSEVDWLAELYAQRGKLIEDWKGISDKQAEIIADLRGQLESTLQSNPN